MKYGIVVRTQLNGVRVYGPYEADAAIAEYQRWEARIAQTIENSYTEGAQRNSDDPVEVKLGTFDLSPEEKRRQETEALVKENT